MESSPFNLPPFLAKNRWNHEIPAVFPHPRRRKRTSPYFRLCTPLLPLGFQTNRGVIPESLSLHAIDVPISDMLMVMPNLLQSHSQLLHQTHSFDPVNAFCDNFLHSHGTKCVIYHCFAGFISIALPPKPPIEKPPQFVLSRLNFTKQYVPDYLATFPVDCCYRFSVPAGEFISVSPRCLQNIHFPLCRATITANRNGLSFVCS